MTTDLIIDKIATTKSFTWNVLAQVELEWPSLEAIKKYKCLTPAHNLKTTISIYHFWSHSLKCVVSFSYKPL